MTNSPELKRFWEMNEIKNPIQAVKKWWEIKRAIAEHREQHLETVVIYDAYSKEKVQRLILEDRCFELDRLVVTLRNELKSAFQEITKLTNEPRLDSASIHFQRMDELIEENKRLKGKNSALKREVCFFAGTVDAIEALEE